MTVPRLQSVLCLKQSARLREIEDVGSRNLVITLKPRIVCIHPCEGWCWKTKDLLEFHWITSTPSVSWTSAVQRVVRRGFLRPTTATTAVYFTLESIKMKRRNARHVLAARNCKIRRNFPPPFTTSTRLHWRRKGKCSTSFEIPNFYGNFSFRINYPDAP